MARLFYYGTIILVFVGLAVSGLIFPRDDEIAFLQYKDKHYSKALVLYELQTQKGNFSPQVVTPLADLYLKYGKIDKAISLMEKFVKRSPNYLDAWEKLGLYYQYGQRYDDYRRNLEKIYQISPNPEILRKLAEIHNFNGDLDRQKPVLKELTTKFPAKRQDYIDLAYLHAVERDYASAVSTLEILLKREETPDPEIVELIMSLLIDAGRPEKALEVAKLNSRKSDQPAMLRYTYRLHSRGEVELAYQLLSPYYDQSPDDPGVFETMVALEMDKGEKDTVFNRLSERFDQNRLPVDVQELFLILLMERNDINRLKATIVVAQLDLLDRDSLLRLINIFQQIGDTDSVNIIQQRFNSDMQSDFPVVHMKLMLITGQENIRKKAFAVRRNPRLSDQKRLQLAVMYTAYHLEDEARVILSDVKSIENVNSVDPYDISNLYITNGLAAQGFQLVNQQRRKKRKQDKRIQHQLEINSATLAMAAGKVDYVRGYLRKAQKPDIQLLTDLYYMADSSKNNEIMLETSRLLISDNTKDDNPYLGFHIDALLAAKRYSEALPFLKRLVNNNQQNWNYVYVDALDKLELRSEWVAFWVAQSARAELSRKEKRSIAYALLEKGYWVEAQVIFHQLSEKQGPDDPDVNQLVYLWETHSFAAGLKWLAGRTTQADRAEKRRWFNKYYRLAVSLKQDPEIEFLIDQHPDMIDTLTLLEIENNQKERAFVRLKTYYQEGRLKPVSVIALLRLAIEYRDKPTLNLLVVNAQKMGLSSNELIRVFNLVLENLSQNQIQAYRETVGDEFLRNNSVIEFMFDVAEKKTIDQRRIHLVSKDPDIDSSHQLLIAGFLLKHGLKTASEEMLDRIRKSALSSDQQKITMAYLYLEMGRPEVALKMFDRKNELRKGKEEITTNQMDRVYLLLAAAAGKQDEVADYTRKSKVDPLLLTDMYYVSMDFKRHLIALAVSRKLHQIQPNNQTLTFLTRALHLNGRYSEALDGLKKLYQNNPGEWEFLYVESLEKSGKNEFLRNFWKDKLNNSRISEQKKREIAFILLEMGYRKDAEDVFLRAAETSKADSQAVQQLLYLWGIRPRPYALAWLENRLKKAPIDRQAGWLNILMGVGQEDLVIRFINRNQKNATPEMMDTLLQIFVNRRDKVRFEETAASEINKSKRVRRLHKIAQWSLQLDKTNITISAYEKGLRLDPENKQILNEYGKLTYYQGQYVKSEELLKRFIELGGLDRISMYFYAEILQRKNETRSAKIYYQKTLDLISILLKKQIPDRILEAKIKFQLGEREESLNLFKSLIKQYPNNSDIKADYIELLIEMGYTEEAEKLLVGI